MADRNISSLLNEGKLKDAKVLIRSSVGEQERCSVWKKILEVRTTDSFCCSSLYWDTVDTCYGGRSLVLEAGRDRLPGCVDPHHLPRYGLSAEEAARVSRLLTVFAYNSPEVSHLPLLYPATALLLLTGLSEEEAYSFISLLVSPSSSQTVKYFTQTRSGWDVLCFSLKPLAVKYVKGSVAFIEEEFSSESEEFFQSWPWWIFEELNTSILLRLMDCYLLEGHKVLFRSALALLKTFFKSINTKSDLYQTAKSAGLISTFSQYAKSLAMSPNDFLKIAFKFPRFSKADIAKLSAKLEMEAKANRLTRAGRPRSSEDVRQAGGRPGLSFSTPQHRPSGSYPIHQLVSELLSREQILSIWDELPERIISVKPTLAYSSNEHGVSLTTFFNRVDKYEPTILVVRTSEKEVFGAYCSTSWAQRNQKDDKGLRMRYFGTGETFLFKFQKGSILTKYEWVKKNISDDEEEESPKKKERGKELFMSADNTMLTVGGGNGLAIYLDENLHYGQTERCDTFDNDPLCSVRDFTINSIEVFGFVDISW